MRHMIRHVVKLGHYQQFMTAMAAWNVEATRLGLPRYRIWESQHGVVQEVFTEAEFEDLGAHQSTFETAHADVVFAAANDEVSAHLVDGSLYDYILEEV